MSAITLKAHYNGKRICLDEPYKLQRDSKLIVTVVSGDSLEDERQACWLRLKPVSPAPTVKMSRIISTPRSAKRRQTNERGGRNSRSAATSGWPTKPCKPGIGVELDWDAIDRACVEHTITKVS
jgi:hypothetical protein